MRFFEVLSEGMRPLAGQAAYVTPLEGGTRSANVVLYNPTTASLDNVDFLAIGILHPYNKEFWFVGSIMAANGYGPTMYAVMADLATMHGAMLMRSALVSVAAKKMWSKFEQNSHVEVVPVADRVARNGRSYNPTDTGFALKGLGTIGLSEAIDLDKEITARLGDEWHEKMVVDAMAKLKARMDRL